MIKVRSIHDFQKSARNGTGNAYDRDRRFDSSGDEHIPKIITPQRVESEECLQ